MREISPKFSLILAILVKISEELDVIAAILANYF